MYNILNTNELYRRIINLESEIKLLKKNINELKLLHSYKRPDIIIEDNTLTNIIDDFGDYFILNEGEQFSMNSSISYLHSGNMYNNYFETVNNKLIGELANDIYKYDDYIFYTSTGSKYICKLNLKCEELNRYTFPEDEGAPRCITSDGEFIYVSQYGGTISKFEFDTLKLVSKFSYKDNTDNFEGIIEKDQKIYVCNSHKYEDGYSTTYNNEILIIDPLSMKQTGVIYTNHNPVRIYNINNELYIISYGIKNMLQKIENNIAIDITTATKICCDNNYIYGIDQRLDSNGNISNSFFLYDFNKKIIHTKNYLSDIPSNLYITPIYLLNVYWRGDYQYIFLATTDYISKGKLYCFVNGKLFKTYETGVNPNKIIAI